MNAKTEFLTKAIEESQRAIHYVDVKAAALVVFESALLIVVIVGLASNSLVRTVRTLLDLEVTWFAALLVASFIVFAMALIVHILLTIRVILPVDNPETHINLGDYRPRRLFYLNRLDHERRIVPSMSQYSEKLYAMADEDIISEYIYELLKLSYIRRIKSERLTNSFLFLGGLIIGVATFGFLLILAGIVY